MGGVPIAAVGSLVRDIVYLDRRMDSERYLVGSRGGGALWNALVNARINGARTLALCVGGSDQAAQECIRDLRVSGVTIAAERLRRGKRTRTLHELLDWATIGSLKPKHMFQVRCPVCDVETYRRGAALLKKEDMLDFGRILRKEAESGILLHLDGLDTTRLDVAKSLKQRGSIVSADLGRSTGLHRMRQTSVLERLATIDVLFVHSNVLPELQRMIGVATSRDLIGKLGIRLLVATKGEKGATLCLKTEKEVVSFDQLPPRPNPLVDTAGAGDALIGYFLSKLSEHSPHEISSLLETSEYLVEVLAGAQRWAARKCGFVGARGHVAGADGRTWSWDAPANLVRTSGTLSELKITNLSRTRCSACDSPRAETTQASIDTLRFQQNVIGLPVRVERAWSKRRLSPWETLAALRGSGYVVGTGGSFVVAEFLALLLSQSLGTAVIPTHPFDFIRIAVPSSWAIFISNSGKTPDIHRAMEHASRMRVPRTVLITGVSPGEIELPQGTENALVLYTGANGERGFLSVAGVIVPCFMAWSSLSGGAWSADDGYRSFHRLYESAKIAAHRSFATLEKRLPEGFVGKRVLILGGGFAWPAMLDLESKLLEGGLGNPEVSEIKDYSHGRFVSSIDGGVATIVCGMPDDEPYRRFLVSRLNRQNAVVELVSDRVGVEGALDLLLQAEHLMRLCAERAGVDPSKPQVSPLGLELYKYRDILDFKEGD